MIIPIATICFVSVLLGSTGVDARVPPKFVKAVNSVGKALYAGRYGYSVAPIPPHITMQANIARKEVHLPPRMRKKRRPIPRRPYASQYQEYTPAPIKKKHRPRRPPKSWSKPRPPHYREQDYYDEDEVEEEPDYDYEEKPKKRYKQYKEGQDDDFVALHSELYSSGYNPGRKKIKYREDEPNFDQTSSVFVRRPKPNVKSWTGVMRPSNKLYSAAIGAPSRPVIPKDEKYRDEEDDEDEPIYKDKNHKKRYRDDEEEIMYREKDRDEEYYNPDNIYHDRTYQSKQKRRERGTEEKEAEARAKLREEERKKEEWRTREEKRKVPTWRQESEVREEDDQPSWWVKPDRERQERDRQESERQERRPILPILQRDPMDGWRPGENPEQPKQDVWTHEPIQTVRWVEPSAPSAPSAMPPSQRPPLQPSPPSPTVQQHRFENSNSQERWPEVNPTSNYKEISTPKPKKRKSNKSQRTRNAHINDGNREQIVAQRVVGGVVKWNNQEEGEKNNWKMQGFRQNINTPSATSYEVDTIPTAPEGDIVYGSRLNDGQQPNKWRKELDIGYGQGMEVMVDDKVAGWQVY